MRCQAGDEVELIPGGRDIPVTARNRMQVRPSLMRFFARPTSRT